MPSVVTNLGSGPTGAGTSMPLPRGPSAVCCSAPLCLHTRPQEVRPQHTCLTGLRILLWLPVPSLGKPDALFPPAPATVLPPRLSLAWASFQSHRAPVLGLNVTVPSAEPSSPACSRTGSLERVHRGHLLSEVSAPFTAAPSPPLPALHTWPAFVPPCLLSCSTPSPYVQAN